MGDFLGQLIFGNANTERERFPSVQIVFNLAVPIGIITKIALFFHDKSKKSHEFSLTARASHPILSFRWI